jgi:hypothetical protein
MAFQVNKLLDTQKRLVVLVVGTNNVAATTLIDAGGLAYALNANGQLNSAGSGSDRLNTYRMALKYIKYDVQSGTGTGQGYIQIYWENVTSGAANSTIVNIGGFGDLGFLNQEDSIVVTQNTAFYNVQSTSSAKGNVGFVSNNFGGNAAFTLLLDFRKNPNDYDQGQFEDPVSIGTTGWQPGVFSPGRS